MKRLAVRILVPAALCAAICALPAAAPAAGCEGASAFGLCDLGLTMTPGQPGDPPLQAGSHPAQMTTSIGVRTREEGGEAVPVEEVKDIVVALPPGFAGDPYAAPRCSTVDFLVELVGNHNACAEATVVGEVTADVLTPPEGATGHFKAKLYNLAPPPGKAARLGFIVDGKAPGVVDLGISAEAPYHVVASSPNVSQVLPVLGAQVRVEGVLGEGRPFLTLPTRCEGPLSLSAEADPWPHPGAWVGEAAQTAEAMSGCEGLAFAPEAAVRPTTDRPASPSGLRFELDVSDPGLADPAGRAASEIKKAVVELPRGVTLNPSQAEGLATCSEADVARERYDSEPGEGCPEASKVGTVEAQSPLLEGRTFSGALYVATPYENPSHSLIALYMVVKDRQLGVNLVFPGKVEPESGSRESGSGQLTTTFDDLIQWPLSHVTVRLREGARAPLITPRGCGDFQTRATFTPWAGGPSHTATSSFHIGGGPCPATAPFSPGFEAGTLSNQAGSYSPFLMRLTRSDGEQDMGRFSFVLPPGVVTRLAGIPYCSEAQIAQAKSRTGPHGGREELDSPSCPAASQIGTTLAGAGVGSQLTYVPGRLYLAGPWHGDPISAVAIVPGVAGPFDVGTVVVREALRLNPVTHVAEVDGAASDPIPHILEGIPLNVREVRVAADRPQFALNPTSCEPFEARSTIWGDGTALEPLAPHPVDLSARFQAAGCASLGFKPRLGLKLRGGTRRGAFPALKAVYAPRRHGDANLRRLALLFPSSEFIEQGHFRTICTRVQFAAGPGFGARCPKGSVYGHIEVWTPLLSEPLKGPVYLRSSNHNLPDAVFALHGLVDIEIATRIDSVHGRLRAIVQNAPDAPVSHAIVHMQGGRKGLFVNSRGLCARPGLNRARVNAGAQNGRREVSRPAVRALGCAKAKHRRHGRHRRR